MVPKVDNGEYPDIHEYARMMERALVSYSRFLRILV